MRPFTLLRLCGLLVIPTVGVGCSRWPGGGGSDTARTVQLFNCTHVSGPTMPPSGRSFNIYTRVDNGAWVSRGSLDPQPGPWSDCHDASHTAASLTINLLEVSLKSGQHWEIREIEVPRNIEPPCDSSAPDVQNACQARSTFFTASISGAYPAKVDLTETGG